MILFVVVDFDKIKAKYLPWCYNSYSQHIGQAFGAGISHPAVWFVDTRSWKPEFPSVSTNPTFSKEFCRHKLFNLPRKAGQEAKAAEIRVQKW